MMKVHTILLTLGIVILFSCNAVEGGAYINQGILSRKGLKEERKLIMTGVSPSLSGLSREETSNTDAGHVNSNSESTETDVAGVVTAYTPMTAATTDSHHDISVDQYRKIIRNNGIKP
ncbi:hypothetical protein PR202_gb25829 [Eleusine coracana subsp. coracana]|uniref:Uncharacterized protein n=1 Tax=Eleusine coracana subsp. coracana TaxID=191504 RepID=A0AAV5FQ53_ELECO|nr:hypothetical protein QOZ80_4BG0354060 [Eleusine coracana subsp. coracana]GJN36892.1 hypothetical protein PR202_gb25793 [Eleusine coracana subsp. coracana]GJN36925.1 hypothetical protein PR202_gb25829 [Eleusine coracana subsp. coracana]